MADPNIFTQFAQNQPSVFRGITQGIRGLGQQAIAQKKQRDYKGLLATAMQPEFSSDAWIAAMNAAPEAEKENVGRAFQIKSVEEQQRLAAEAARIKAEKIKAAQDAFNLDQTPVNMEAVRAADPEGFESWNKAWNAIDKVAKTHLVQSNMEVLGQIATGKTEDAVLSARRFSEAFLNDKDTNNDEDGRKWEEFAKKIEDGNGRDVYKELMAVTSAEGDIGPKALESFFAGNADARSYATAELEEDKFAEAKRKAEEAERIEREKLGFQKTELGLAVLKAGADLEKDGASLDIMREAALNDKEFGEDTLTALNYATALKGGLEYNATDFNDVLFSLGDKFQKNAKRYFDERTANTTVNSAIDYAIELANSPGVDPMDIGFADITAINLMQRQIDPATVREGDVHLIRQAQSLANQFKTLTKGWTSGAILSPDQRASFKALSAKIVEAQKAKVDEVYYPASHASFKRVVEEAGRSDNIDTLWKEVYSGYTPPEKIPVDAGTSGAGNLGAGTAEVEAVRDFYISQGREYWTDAEWKELLTPGTTLERFEAMAPNAWAKYNSTSNNSSTTEKTGSF